MAISARFRSGIPLFQSLLTAQSFAASRSIPNPTIAKSQGLRNFATGRKPGDDSIANLVLDCLKPYKLQLPRLAFRSVLLGEIFDRLLGEAIKWLSPRACQLLRQSYLTNTTFQRQGFSSSASSESPESNDKESKKSVVPDREATRENGDSAPLEETQDAGVTAESKHPEPQSIKRRRRSSAKRTAFSDSDTEDDLSIDDRVQLVALKKDLKLKDKEIEKMQDKVLRSYAEMENVLERTKRQAENSKKFAIQNFAKNLLDVADNLGRASSVVKDSFSKIDSSKDTAGAVPLLKTLLEGVEMTEKQLAEVFRKFCVEKFDPIDEQFDPHRHHAVFQIPNASKPPGTVAVVLKSGYMLHDRVLRPAEVGCTEAPNDESIQTPGQG